MMPVRVLEPNGRGTTLKLALGIEWAVQNGADVLNISLGTIYYSFLLRDVIRRAEAAGVVVVAAAGNKGQNQIQYPAGYASVIGVTAVDAGNIKASFANFGANWVDLAGPGVGITSTIIGPQGSGYASWSGTSMATPFISGGAALARQKHPSATPAAISELL
ncbi:MAG TPA: S8 family serine peptidase, partial [Caldilineaceae bacterium]|nr:S8 family serine peptidase [Caldilineaceae bacterium]